MTITLYTNNSEKNKVTKDLTELTELTGTLRDSCSITSPVIRVGDISEYLTALNYAYIPEFGRYYFINEIKTLVNSIFEITMKCDVLMSFADEIKANQAIIARNENSYNLLLNDGIFKTQQNPRIEQFQFPAGFTTLNYVLALAGQ